MQADRWSVFLLVGLVLLTAGCASEPGSPGTGDADGDAEMDTRENSSSEGSGDEEGATVGEGEDRPRTPPNVTLEPVVSGLQLPLGVTSAGDGTGRLFVLEQAGTVRVVRDGTLREEPYMDLTEKTKAEGERGLLGLAFSPSFAEDGRLFVSYTNETGDSVLARYTVDDPPRGTPSGNGSKLLTVEQPYGNHNGGHIAFGPEGYLYYGLGDGGSGGDPEGNGQDPTTLLGSMLRLDVSGEQALAPPDNPFVGEEGHDLVWAYGLRNPWRFSFDRETGDLYIGDVGQESWEEVSRQPASSDGGENYGWNRWEGNHTYAGEPSREGYTFPSLEYAREGERCSVTGGYVYRGQAIEDLQGFYLYADFCAGTIWAAQNTSEGWRSDLLLDTEHKITSFGEDADGELYVVARNGSLYRISAG